MHDDAFMPAVSPFAGRLRRGGFVSLVELLRPRVGNSSALVVRTSRVHAAGVDAVSVPDRSPAVPRMDSTDASHAIRQELGAATITHFRSGGRSRRDIEADLRQARALGLAAVLAVTAVTGDGAADSGLASIDLVFNTSRSTCSTPAASCAHAEGAP